MAKTGPASMPDAAAEPSQPLPESFEQALIELEELVRRMEGGELTLEASLAAYRRGAALVSFCRQSLADVQQQVKILEGGLLRPFEADAAGQG